MLEFELITRLGAACLLGGVIGFDREMQDRPAGLRTHMLAALASALFTMISLQLATAFEVASDRSVSLDPLRAIEAVTAGVAFIAAGTIIQARGSVHGLTTGAALWLAGAVGIACGAGYYLLAFAATIIAVAILVGLGWLEKRFLAERRKKADAALSDDR